VTVQHTPRRYAFNHQGGASVKRDVFQVLQD